MPIGIIGASGNMGKRYTSICNYLSIPCVGFDIDNINTIWEQQDSLESLLIATPTDTHMEMVSTLGSLGKPMLVEKPFSKDMEEVEKICEWDLPVRMVNQYEYLYDSDSNGFSIYDYWNSGKDGVFDFINIIGLSNQPPVIKNISPIWTCEINGKRLSLSDMDQAYCDMILDWYHSPTPNLEYILKAHKRVQEGFYVR